MSLIITIHVEEGIVMASDSRTTFNTQDFSPLPDGKGAIITKYQGVHYSDTTYKTFLAPNNTGISTCGAATINGKPLTGYVEKFIHDSIQKDTDICDVPALLLAHFRSYVPIPDIVFQVAGYSKTGTTSVQKVYRVFVMANRIDELDASSQGAAWNGETEILSRIINSVWTQRKGKDQKTGEEIVLYDELKAPPIPWNFFSLQDGIDFATYAINTTIETMRFQERLKTVGGPIDILIIKPDGAFWASHKTLHVRGKGKR